MTVCNYTTITMGIRVNQISLIIFELITNINWILCFSMIEFWSGFH